MAGVLSFALDGCPMFDTLSPDPGPMRPGSEVLADQGQPMLGVGESLIDVEQVPERPTQAVSRMSSPRQERRASRQGDGVVVSLKSNFDLMTRRPALARYHAAAPAKSSIPAIGAASRSNLAWLWARPAELSHRKSAPSSATASHAWTGCPPCWAISSRLTTRSTGGLKPLQRAVSNSSWAARNASDGESSAASAAVIRSPQGYARSARFSIGAERRGVDGPNGLDSLCVNPRLVVTTQRL